MYISDFYILKTNRMALFCNWFIERPLIIYVNEGESMLTSQLIVMLVSACPYYFRLEACPVNKTDLRSLDFTVDWVFMKLFKTGNIEIVRECQAFFGFKLPSVLLNMSSNKFFGLYNFSDNDVCTSLRVN